jgi:hypothetical protein
MADFNVVRQNEFIGDREYDVGSVEGERLDADLRAIEILLHQKFLKMERQHPLPDLVTARLVVDAEDAEAARGIRGLDDEGRPKRSSATVSKSRGWAELGHKRKTAAGSKRTQTGLTCGRCPVSDAHIARRLRVVAFST